MDRKIDIHKAGGILIKDRKFLVERSVGKQFFVALGGSLEPGETSKQALIRELLELVKDKKIYGYGFEKSNPEFNSYEGNVWAGPELAWCTDGSMKRKAFQWVESIINAINGNYQTQVNL